MNNKLVHVKKQFYKPVTIGLKKQKYYLNDLQKMRQMISYTTLIYVK